MIICMFVTIIILFEIFYGGGWVKAMVKETAMEKEKESEADSEIEIEISISFLLLCRWRSIVLLGGL